MFLIRAAFWLGLVLLILPTNAETQKEVVGAAEAAFSDLAGFCLRNPEVCDNGRQAVERLIEKAMFGTRLVARLVTGAPTEIADAGQSDEFRATPALSTPATALEAQPTDEEAPVATSSAQNTLTDSDLMPVWHRPRG